MIDQILRDREGLYVALGGGAARGLAHLGVLKALEDSGIPIAGICGTSMGALVGASYALLRNADQVIEHFKSHMHSTHYNQTLYTKIRAAMGDEDDPAGKWATWMRQGPLMLRSMARGSIAEFEEYSHEIAGLIPNAAFTATKIPFFAVAVDLLNAREVVFNRGSLRAAVMASSAIPGVFPTIRARETLYVDGGWMNKVPVSPLIAQGAVRTLAIDVIEPQFSEFNPRRGLSVAKRADQVGLNRLMELQAKDASIMWKPPLDALHPFAFEDVDKAVTLGYEYAMGEMQAVHTLMKPEPRKPWPRRIAEKLLRRWLEEGKPLKEPGFELRGIWEATPVD